MDILVPSFNRPYSLERCIKSIYTHVRGKYTIKILDDGTPLEYLNKISKLFPEVDIIKSPKYDMKVKMIHDHFYNISKYNHYFIPVELWYNSVSKASDIFLLIEDDNWFFKDFDIGEAAEVIKKNNFVALGIFWRGNEKFIQGEKLKIDGTYEEIFPAIPFLSRKLMLDNPYAKRVVNFLERNRMSSPLYRLKMLQNEYDMRWPFYTLYLITSSFFRKDYWLYLWKGAPQKFDEVYQLKRATRWFEKNKARYGKTIREVTRISHLSSATNSFADINFDVFCFHHYMNLAWLNDELDGMNNFPNDYSFESVKKVLDKAHDDRCTYENWLKWVDRFKTQYRNIGVDVDSY